VTVFVGLLVGKGGESISLFNRSNVSPRCEKRDDSGTYVLAESGRGGESGTYVLAESGRGDNSGTYVVWRLRKELR
jgi:hypothetical protein